MVNSALICFRLFNVQLELVFLILTPTAIFNDACMVLFKNVTSFNVSFFLSDNIYHICWQTLLAIYLHGNGSLVALLMVQLHLKLH